MEERLLSKNSFEMPTVLKDDQAAVVFIIRLITMDPGTDPLHPDMGVGLFSKYRYSFEDEVKSKLRAAITEQINTYIPQLSGVSVSIEARIASLFITIQFNSTIVTIVADSETKTIKLSDL